MKTTFYYKKWLSMGYWVNVIVYHYIEVSLCILMDVQISENNCKF